jgi:hypothetical protein
MLFWHLAADRVKLFNYNHYDTENFELTQTSAVFVEFFRGFSPAARKTLKARKHSAIILELRNFSHHHAHAGREQNIE